MGGRGARRRIGAAPAPAPAEEAAPATDDATTETVPSAAPESEPAPERSSGCTAAAVVVEPEPEIVLEAVPFRRRVRTAMRVGAWTGAGLGLIGFVVASNWWTATATVIGERAFTPVIQVDSNAVVIGAALISIVFGAVIASLSRAAASWANPGMQLSNSPSSTAWVGALIGVLLGVVAGAVLTGWAPRWKGRKGWFNCRSSPPLA